MTSFLFGALVEAEVSMEPASIKDLVTSEWQPDSIPNEIRVALDDASGTKFSLEIVLPLRRPYFYELTRHLEYVERRARLATIFALGDWERVARFPDLNSLLSDHPIPLVVVSLGVSSIKVTVEGDAEEVSRFLGRDGKPPKSWKRRLVKTLAAVFSGSLLIVTLSGQGIPSRPPWQVPPPPTQEQVRQTIESACGYLPDGSEVTAKLPGVEVKVICKKPPARD